MQKKSEKKRIGTLGIVLVVIGIVIVLGIAWLAIDIFVNNKVLELMDESKYGDYLSVCMSIRLTIDSIDTEGDTITIKRMAGGDVSVPVIKLLANKQNIDIILPQDQSLKQLETKTYTADYDIKEGDEIEVAPVIEIKRSQISCEIIDKKTA